MTQLEQVTVQIKQRIIELEHEVEYLKAQMLGHSDALTLIQNAIKADKKKDSEASHQRSARG